MQTTHSKEEQVVRTRSGTGPVQFDATPGWREGPMPQPESAWQVATPIAVQPPTFGLPPAPAYPGLIGFQVPQQAQAFLSPQQAFSANPQAQAIGIRYPLPTPNLAPGSRVPAIDLVDEGSEFVCQVELPGVKRENVDVSCFERGILVTAHTEPDIDLGALLVAERASAASFRRAVNLPGAIQPSGAKATLRDGVLTVNLPKSTPSEGPRRVPVA